MFKGLKLPWTTSSASTSAYPRTKQFLEESNIPIPRKAPVADDYGSKIPGDEDKQLHSKLHQRPRRRALYFMLSLPVPHQEINNDGHNPATNLIGEKGFEYRASLTRGFNRASIRHQSQFTCLCCRMLVDEAITVETVDRTQIVLCQSCYLEFGFSHEPEMPMYELGSAEDAGRFGVGRYDLGTFAGPPAKRTQTCSICNEDLPTEDFTLPTSKCLHDPEYCRDCLRQSISSDLESKGWDKIRCPDTRCKRVLEDADILRLAPGQIYETYSKLSILAALSTMDDFRSCLRPGCNSGQIHSTGEDGPIFTCHECGFKVCTIHNIEWHDGETCKEYDYRTDSKLKKKEEKATAKTLNDTTKPCPSCNAPIEKNEGCDHMTCRKRGCGFEFCWLCLAPYDPIRRIGNSKHKRSCKYYDD
ncbi:hypothetical protein NA57DRAFT_51735 [Rhizodiscina lignyota]|uniref:RBR-type E3 ubiquitin transferase n=1 Tax=Rhizodiscina lignyota TaxID=1504668 RepID=A0A9P4INW0_9PEZI|nr:hypothetical protein NA57DRAFT_51735 [Rhizodiscina lignyota]